MLLTITNTRSPATDLGYMLHKHPAKLQSVNIAAGVAHIFYPEVSDEKCTIALLLDIDPIGLVRKSSPGNNDFALEQYVNDRPYVASSFMSAAISQAFATAMNGRCKDKPELVSIAMPFEINLSVIPVRGGEMVFRKLFEPLGYEVTMTRHTLDAAFPTWGESRYYTVRLRNNVKLMDLLTHLYVLIPVCDNDKHYFIGKSEIEKLFDKGKGWLDQHPEKELIVRRYLKNLGPLAKEAMGMMKGNELPAEEDIPADKPAEKVRLHDLRLQTVRDVLLQQGVKSVMDLGCGEGKLLRLLMEKKQFERILGMDISYRSLEIVQDKLKLDRLPEQQKERIQLIQGALNYRDARLNNFEAAALVEVIEHLDEPRLAAMEKVLFEFARPRLIVITTVNAEYNIKYEQLSAGRYRHNDHRFEWTRAEFELWGNRVSETFGYQVKYQPVGEVDDVVGGPSQMALFSR